MSDNSAVIRNFVAAWSRLDPTELAAYFAENGVYHNMPAAPVRGRQNIERFIAEFIKPWTATEWELLSLVSSGDLVAAERVDRITIDGRRLELPCCGLFELRNGQIQVWRDYFDLQTYAAGLTAGMA